MPEATANGIEKVRVAQAAAHPWKVRPSDSSGASYSASQLISRLQLVTTRNDA